MFLRCFNFIKFFLFNYKRKVFKLVLEVVFFGWCIKIMLIVLVFLVGNLKRF